MSSNCVPCPVDSSSPQEKCWLGCPLSTELSFDTRAWWFSNSTCGLMSHSRKLSIKFRLTLQHCGIAAIWEVSSFTWAIEARSGLPSQVNIKVPGPYFEEELWRLLDHSVITVTISPSANIIEKDYLLIISLLFLSSLMSAILGQMWPWCQGFYSHLTSGI